MAQREGRGSSTGERLVVESRETADGSLELLITDSSAEDSEASVAPAAAPVMPEARSIRAPVMLVGAALIALVLGVVTWSVARVPESQDVEDDEAVGFRPYAGDEETQDRGAAVRERTENARRIAAVESAEDSDDEGDEFDGEEVEYEREELPLDRALREGAPLRPGVIDSPEMRLMEATGSIDQRALLREVDRRLDVDELKTKRPTSDIRAIKGTPLSALPFSKNLTKDQPTVVRIGAPDEPAAAVDEVPSDEIGEEVQVVDGDEEGGLVDEGPDVEVEPVDE